MSDEGDVVSDGGSGVYDVLVVGSGIMGSWTAYMLAEKGVKTLLLEQFSLGHQRGSSRGLSRITRRAYRQQFYMEMMSESHKLWRKMEQHSRIKLYIPTGILIFAEQDGGSELEPVISSLEKCGIPYERFTGAEANLRYPGLKLPQDYNCVLEREGGMLLADKALEAIQTQFQALGGVLLDNHKVLRVEPGNPVTIVTNQGKIQARKLVLTSGSWTKHILEQLNLYGLPLQCIRTEVLYWKVDNPERFASRNFPTFWFSPSTSPKDNLVYGLPCHEYPGLLKVCKSHAGPHLSSPEEAEEPRNKVPVSVDVVSQFVRKYLNGVSCTPSLFDTCLYTSTPDFDPIIDRHPLYRNIIFGAGFSGHGFKLAPIIGKVLCELAMDTPPSYDLRPFSLQRFKTVTTQSRARL